MNVASLELCKELYELSGWNSESFWWAEWIADDDYVCELHYYRGGVYGKTREWEYTSAYDLGFLLRKLPPFELHRYENGDYSCDTQGFGFEVADTPEDAAAKLCIELLKQKEIVA